MKRILFFILLVPSLIFAQNNLGKTDDIGRINISAYVPAQEGLTPEATKNLENKLSQLAVKNGMAGSFGSRFIISAKVTTLSKDITPTAPPMHAYTLEFTLYIGDGFEGTLFSSYSFTTKGVGETETKAYMNALKSFNASNPKYQAFIEEGKTKIIEYYNSKCDFILKGAQAMASQDQFDDAIRTLVTVPDICKECYDKSMDTAVEIYKQKIEKDCQLNISYAQTEIAANRWDKALSYLAGYTPDMECYSNVQELIVQIQDHRCAEELAKAQAAWSNRDSKTAAIHLAQISSDSKCYPDSQKLFAEISSKLDEIDKREWEQYKKEQELAHKEKMSAINAAKEIGVAKAKQPINITYKTLW